MVWLRTCVFHWSCSTVVGIGNHDLNSHKAMGVFIYIHTYVPATSLCLQTKAVSMRCAVEAAGFIQKAGIFFSPDFCWTRCLQRPQWLGHPKGNVIFQPSIFSGKLLVSWRVTVIISVEATQISFMFTPIPGEMIQFDEHSFQMGWFTTNMMMFLEFFGVAQNCWIFTRLFCWSSDRKNNEVVVGAPLMFKMET